MSLLPLMKLRLAAPGTLVDIGRLTELRGAGSTRDGGFEIGALTTYAEAARGDAARLRAPTCIRGHRRRPGPQPGHGRWRDRPRRSGLGPAGPGARARLRGRAALAARRTGRADRRVPRRGRSRPTSPPTRSSRRCAAVRCRRARRVRTRSWSIRPRATRSSACARSSRRSGGSVVACAGRADRRRRGGLPRQGGRGGAAGERRFAGRGGRRRRARDRRSDGQRRHPRESRLSNARWRWSTPAARSRPPSPAPPDAPVARTCASSRSLLVGACPGGWWGGPDARDLSVGGKRWTKGRRLSADDLLALAAAEPGSAGDGPRRRARRAARGRRRDPAGQGGRRARTWTPAGRTRAGSTSWPRRAGRRQRPGRGARADQPARPARGLHRVRRPDRRARRPRRERQDRAARRRRRRSSTPRPGWPASAASRSSGSSPFAARDGSGSWSRNPSAGRRAARFEASVRAKVEGLGSTIIDIVYVEDDAGRRRDRDRAVHPRRRHRRPDPHRGLREHGPARRVLRRDRGARRAGRAPRRAGAPGIHALAGARRRDVDPGAADVRGVLEGDGRGPAAAPVAGRRAGLGADGGQARPRRDPDPVAALPVPAVRPGARRARTAEPT